MDSKHHQTGPARFAVGERRRLGTDSGPSWLGRHRAVYPPVSLRSPPHRAPPPTPGCPALSSRLSCMHRLTHLLPILVHATSWLYRGEKGQEGLLPSCHTFLWRAEGRRQRRGPPVPVVRTSRPRLRAHTAHGHTLQDYHASAPLCIVPAGQGGASLLLRRLPVDCCLLGRVRSLAHHRLPHRLHCSLTTPHLTTVGSPLPSTATPATPTLTGTALLHRLSATMKNIYLLVLPPIVSPLHCRSRTHNNMLVLPRTFLHHRRQPPLRLLPPATTTAATCNRFQPTFPWRTPGRARPHAHTPATKPTFPA